MGDTKITYSLGYNNIKISNLKEFMKDNDTILVDIRYNPKSFSIFWNKKYLQNHFNDRYIHLKNLGNLNYKNGKTFKILDLNKGIKELIKIINKYNVIIMCACSDVNKCHRSIIISELFKYEILVKEIE